MKKSFITASVLLIASLANSLAAQTIGGGIKTFDKDGLKFNYPADWTLTDKSSDDLQYLMLSKPNSLVLISIVSPRSIISNYTQFRTMQGDINDRFIIAVKRGLNTPEQTTKEESVCLDFNGRDVTGMRYSGFYQNQPSTGDIFPFVLGDRFINLVYMRGDNDRATGDAVWKDMIRSMYLQNSNRNATALGFDTEYLAAGDVRGRAKSVARPRITSAMTHGFSATAVVRLEIDEKGKVTSAETFTGNNEMRLELIKTAKMCKFEPTIICGKPVKIRGFIVYQINAPFDPRRGY